MSVEIEKAGIEQAIAAAGSQENLAKLLGCSQQNVSFWKGQGFVPLDRVVEVEQVTGVPRAKLIDPNILGVFAVGM